MICRVCNNELSEVNYTKKQWQYKKDMFRNKGYVFCSKVCSAVYCKQISSETMARTNRKYASNRMKQNNPMFRKEIRELVSVKAKGRKLVERGGNGQKIPKAQMILFQSLLAFEPSLEFVVKTKMPRGNGYPTCYKSDIALQKHKIAIEVDGKSHNLLSRKEQDRKKENFLTTLGYKTMRFSNKDVLENLSGCINKIVFEIESREKICQS